MRNILIACLLALSGIASAQISVTPPTKTEGYGKTRWGMTVSQVLTTNSRIKRVTGEHDSFSGGIDGTLSIKDVTIGSLPHKFDVVFGFKNGRLALVLVSFDSKSQYCQYDWYLDSIRKDLMAKYGTPYISGAGEAEWNSGKTQVSLSYFVIDGSKFRLPCSEHLGIAYQPTASAHTSPDL